MRGYTKPTILILCLTAFIAVAATDTNTDYMQTAEDISIMARIIDKTLETEFPDEYKTASLFIASRGCQGIYLKDYGAVFMTSIGFPVAYQTEAPQEESTPDDLWQQTKYELKGVPSRISSMSFAGRNLGENYDSQKAEQLKEVLVRLIGTYAPNIRQLNPKENVVVAVQGTGTPKQLQVKTDNITFREFNKRSSGSYHIETHVDKPKSLPKAVKVPKVPTVAKVDGPKSIVVTTTSDKVARGDTTLIIKVNKENIMAYKDGKLDFSGLINQAEITQY